MKIETQVIHAASQRDPSTKAITPPIHLSTTFERDADGDYPFGHVYSRDTNPNRNELEARMAILETGFEAAAFASGSVAMMSLIQALKTGDHLIVPDNLYYGIKRIIIEIFKGWGLDYTFVDMTDHDAVKQAIRKNTRLVIIETPSNPLIKITDIAAIAEITHNASALLACDNTIATPVFQSPLAHGADFVVHATTKYIGGHSDVLSGIVVAAQDSEYWQRLRTIQRVGGAVASPFDSWLLMRGLQTLPYRMKGISENAAKLAEMLDAHPAIEQVLYPGLESHPQHNIAKKQMSGYGGLMSFLVRGGQDEAMAAAANLKLVTRATSFGGTHTFVEHRASVEQGTTTPQNLLRLSTGLEHIDDLVADFEQALATV